MALPADQGERVIPSTNKRLTRAATFAFTASLSVAACSSSGTTGPTDAGEDRGAVGPIYGAPVDGGALDADGGGIAPLYGMPIDSGADVRTDTGGGGVLYGLPPPDASK